jgi:hypothetical protein
MIDLISDILAQLFPLVAFGVCWWPCCGDPPVTVSCVGCNAAVDIAKQWKIVTTVVNGSSNTCSPGCGGHSGTFYLDYIGRTGSYCKYRTSTTTAGYAQAPTCGVTNRYWHLWVEKVGANGRINIFLQSNAAPAALNPFPQIFTESGSTLLDCSAGSYTTTSGGDDSPTFCDYRVTSVGTFTADVV